MNRAIPFDLSGVPKSFWPSSLDYKYEKRLALKQSPLDPFPVHQKIDKLAEHRAGLLRFLSPECTGLTNTYDETFFINEADHSAVSNTTSETSLLSGTNKQPIIPANYFLGQGSQFRGMRIQAMGVLSTTSTPTIIFQVRTGTTAGASSLSGASVGVTAAITTSSGVTNKWWMLDLRLVCTVRGVGTGNATLAGAGYVMSPGGFASPFTYALNPTTPDTATWTQTFDAAVTQYLNLSITWSAASASNTITCKQLLVTAIG